MKTLKKACAAISSLVLAFALMVPTIAWADDDEMAIRMSYNGAPIVVAQLEGTPHTVSITFHTHIDYAGYENVAKETTFTLADDLKSLRVAGDPIKNDDGSYTVVVSNGNGALPMTDGYYLDLGTLNIKIDGTLDCDSADAKEMTKATIVVTDLDTSDSTFFTTSSIGEGTAQPTSETPFTLAASSFSKVVGTAGGDDNVPDDKKPIVDKPVINVPEEVTPPSDDEIANATTPVVNRALQALWDGKTADGISADDQAVIKEFLEKAKAAGYSIEDLHVQYIVDVLKYDDVNDEALKADKALLDKDYGQFDQLGFYDLHVTMVVSVPADPSLGEASATVTYVDKELPFTVDVASGSLYGKAPVVAYVHEGSVYEIKDGVTADEEQSTVTFSAWEFSTYGVYAKNKLGSPTPNGGNVGGLAVTGDERIPIILLVGAAVLCATLAVIFTRKQDKA